MLQVIPDYFVHNAAGSNLFLTLIVIAISAVATANPKIRNYLSALGSSILTCPGSLFYPVLFISAFILYASISHFVFGAIPRIDDSVSALFQAKIFLSGHLSCPTPQPMQFYTLFSIVSPKCAAYDSICSMYLPGWAALLAIGESIHAAWLVSPVLGAMLDLSICRIGSMLYGERTGRFAGILAASSPFILFQSGMFLSHIPTALFLSLTLIFVLYLLKTGERKWGALAGLSWSIALLCRPMDAAVIGSIYAILILIINPREIKNRIGGIAAGIIAASIGIAIMLAWQTFLSGDPFTTGHSIQLEEKGSLGFAEDFTFLDACTITRLRFAALNRDLLGWPVASTLVLIPCIIPLFRKKQIGQTNSEEAPLSSVLCASVRNVLMIAPMIAMLFAVFFFWYYEEFFPARYLTSSIPCFFILAAYSISLLSKKTKFFVLVCGTLFLLTVAIPVRMKAFGPTFGDVDLYLRHAIKQNNISNAIVFMDAYDIKRTKHDLEDDRNVFYAAGFMRNKLNCNASDIIFAHNRRSENFKLASLHPERETYLYRINRCRNTAILYKLNIDNNSPEEQSLEQLSFFPQKDSERQ